MAYIGAFIVAGFASGYLSGLFGIGGGILRIPLFVILFPLFGIHAGLEVRMAAVTSLALAVPTGVLALRKHVKLGNFDLPYFRLWAVGLIVGVGAGLALLPYVSDTILKILFIAFLLIMACYFGCVPDRFTLGKSPPQGLLKMGIAAFVGAYSVMIGVSGGSMATPIMRLVNRPILQGLALGSGTSLVVSVLGTAGGIWHGWDIANRPDWCLGYIDGIVFAVMLPGVLWATPWGVSTATGMNKDRLKIVYAVFLVIIAATMIAHMIWA